MSLSDRPYRHAWELFHRAVRSLATGSGPLRSRLQTAYVNHLSHLQNDEVPKNLLSRVDAIRQGMTRNEGAGDEGRVAATMRTMTDEDARRMADEIVDLYDVLTRRDAIDEAS